MMDEMKQQEAALAASGSYDAIVQCQQRIQPLITELQALHEQNRELKKVIAAKDAEIAKQANKIEDLKQYIEKN